MLHDALQASAGCGLTLASAFNRLLYVKISGSSPEPLGLSTSCWYSRKALSTSRSRAYSPIKVLIIQTLEKPNNKSALFSKLWYSCGWVCLSPIPAEITKCVNATHATSRWLTKDRGSHNENGGLPNRKNGERCCAIYSNQGVWPMHFNLSHLG